MKSMPLARDIFDDPDAFRGLLTATNDGVAERQFLDRKQVPFPSVSGAVLDKDLNRFLDQVVETVSAFANGNRDAGLLVIGIAKDGQILGIDHLTEHQRLRLSNFNGRLRNEYCQARSHPFTVGHETKHVLFIYVPYTPNAICETADNERRAWMRNDLQNIPLTPDRRAAVERDKGVASFENGRALNFSEDDIDMDVLAQFRQSFLTDPTAFSYGTPELLKKAGAIERERNGTSWITNAGLLFFGKNPQERFARAYIRLMKFDYRADDPAGPGLPSVDKTFDGPLTVQLRNIRAFLQSSGFFKTYQRRAARGGFIDEPELPFIAVDEAIVNAVGHRDYAVNAPIEVRLYRDALILTNPGRVFQSGHDLPDEFQLERTELDSATRNPKIVEWLRTMKDANGRAFVQLLSEGTKRMTKEMLQLSLPSPEFHLNPFASKLILYSRAGEREAAYRRESIATTEFANLFSLRIDPPATGIGDEQRWDFIWALNLALMNRLKSEGWFVDSFRFGRITVHQRNTAVRLPPAVQRFVRIFPAYSLHVKQFFGRVYLCVDYDVQVKNALRLRDLARFMEVKEFEGRRALVRHQEWQDAKLVECSAERCRATLFESNQLVTVPSDQVYPLIPTWRLAEIMQGAGVNEDLHRRVKEESLSLRPKAARLRAEKTTAAVDQLAQTIFPISVLDRTVQLDQNPVLLPRQSDRTDTLILHTLEEPTVRFDHQHETKDIREGITRFGAYEEHERTIELIPVCTPEVRDQMASLIERLKAGSFRYKGAERTFKARLQYGTITTAPDPESIVSEIERLVAERPEWRGDSSLNRIFLVYAPTANWASDDASAPYFRAKRVLLEAGIPCQMVNQPTLANPDWKDLNLALNIVAKCGVTPWVLPESIPDADFFVGLSYTQGRDNAQEKYLGYANVFNQFGRWEFYTGSGETFPYTERAAHFERLVRSTLERLAKQHSLQPSPNIAFHYSAKFSREDRSAILAGARAIRPNGRYTFVWLNSHHITRFYDQKPESDGSLQRGGYVITGPGQLYISTTGFNPYRKSLGTPMVLEANVHVEVAPGSPSPTVDHKAVAAQILSLTKLNWASTDSLCGEPITTKYAGDIAYLTAAFLRQKATFRLHPILEATPWFI